MSAGDGAARDARTEGRTQTEIGEARGVVCTVCGAFCDDLVVAADGRLHFEDADVECERSREWRQAERPLELRTLLRGEEIHDERGYAAAAQLLRTAKAPSLLVGPSVTVDTLGELLQFAFEQSMPVFAWPPAAAGNERSGKDAPELTASLGEVRSTADLVVYWGGDIGIEQPRHVERYAGSADRIVELSFDEGPAAIGLDLVAALHLELLGRTREIADSDRPKPGIECEDPTVLELVELIESAEHTAVFLIGEASGDRALRDALGALAAQVRHEHRISVHAARSAGNVRGVEDITSALTGEVLPLVLRDIFEKDVFEKCGRGAESLAGIVDARDLRRGDWTDCIVACGTTAPGADASPETATEMETASEMKTLRTIAGDVPRIVIDSVADPEADVSWVTPGLDPRIAGSVVRGDGVWLRLSGSASGGADPCREVVHLLRETCRELSS